jgi:class I fructose-bisphosphate aldolase
MVDGALKAGAKGLSIGRNAFQHENPEKIVAALSKMVHENMTVEQAEQFLKS